MLPTDDRWSFASDSRFTLAEEWLGTQLPKPDREALVRRHLGAFGPATAADVQNWSGLKGLKDTVEGMADELAAFKLAAARSTTCPTLRAPTRRPRRRRGCCPSSTACCSPIRTGRG